MRSFFAFLALLAGASPAVGQIVAVAPGPAIFTVAQTTSLYDEQTLRGTQALFPGTRLRVRGCVRQDGEIFYDAVVAASGERGLVRPAHARLSSGRRPCPVTATPALREPGVLRYAPAAANLHAGPGLTFDIVGALRSGETVRIAYCRLGWCSVFDPDLASPLPEERRGYLPERALSPAKPLQ